MKRIIARYSPLFILAGLSLVLAFGAERFATPDNLKEVVSRTSDVAVMAVGQTAVILTGGIDLSVGSVAALSQVVTGKLVAELGWPVWLGIAMGLLTGLLCGVINGLLVTKGKLPPFIATLGMMMVARGISHIITGSLAIFGMPQSFGLVGGAQHWWVPVLLTLVITGVFSVALTFTRFGRSLYAIGGNMQSARLSGVPTDRVRTFAYALSGLLAGLGGIVMASRIMLPSPTAAQGYELNAIAACVIGGASLMGGEGGALGALAGALIMSVLVNFCNLRELDPYWQSVLVGVLVVVLVLYDTWRKRRAGLLRD